MKNKIFKILIIASIFFAFKADVRAKDGVCTATKLNVRSGAGTEYPGVGYIMENDRVTVKGSGTDSTGKIWYKIHFTSDGKKKTGYAISDYIKLSKKAKKSTKAKKKSKVKEADGKRSYKGVVKAQGLRVRVKPGQNSRQATLNGEGVSLNNGETIKIIGEKYSKKEKWYKIKTKKIKGFVHSDYVKLSLKKEIPATVKKAVLRSKPKANKGKIIRNCEVNIFYEITLGSVKYFKVRYKDMTGYVRCDEVKIIYKDKKRIVKNNEDSRSEDKVTDNKENDVSNTDNNITDNNETGSDVISDDDNDISSSEISDFNAKKGSIISESVLYSEPSYNSEIIKDENIALKLKEGQEIFVRKKYDVGEKWYLVTYVLTNSKNEQIIGAGFIPEKFVKLNS